MGTPRSTVAQQYRYKHCPSDSSGSNGAGQALIPSTSQWLAPATATMMKYPRPILDGVWARIHHPPLPRLSRIPLLIPPLLLLVAVSVGRVVLRPVQRSHIPDHGLGELLITGFSLLIVANIVTRPSSTEYPRLISKVNPAWRMGCTHHREPGTKNQVH